MELLLDQENFYQKTARTAVLESRLTSVVCEGLGVVLECMQLSCCNK